MYKQREKLIELISEYHDTWKHGQGDWKSGLADHLLANGVIVPPVKVGDTVYGIAKLFTQTIIVEGKVYGFSITHELGSNSKYLLCFLAKGKEFERTNYSMWFDFSDFGKTVFLSREAAEKALKANRPTDTPTDTPTGKDINVRSKGVE